MVCQKKSNIIEESMHSTSTASSTSDGANVEDSILQNGRRIFLLAPNKPGL